MEMKYGFFAFCINFIPIVFAGILVFFLIKHLFDIRMSFLQKEEKIKSWFITAQIIINTLLYIFLQIRWVIFYVEPSPLFDVAWALNEAIFLANLALFIGFAHPLQKKRKIKTKIWKK